MTDTPSAAPKRTYLVGGSCISTWDAPGNQCRGWKSVGGLGNQCIAVSSSGVVVDWTAKHNIACCMQLSHTPRMMCQYDRGKRTAIQSQGWTLIRVAELWPVLLNSDPCCWTLTRVAELCLVLLNSDPCSTILASHAKRRQCHRHADRQQAAYPWVAKNGPSLPWYQTFASIFQTLTEASHCQQ